MVNGEVNVVVPGETTVTPDTAIAATDTHKPAVVLDQRLSLASLVTAVYAHGPSSSDLAVISRALRAPSSLLPDPVGS